MNESIFSERAPDPLGPYPHVKKVNNFLFLSGVGPRKKGSLTIPGVELDEDGNILSYDIEKQARSVFENVRMILEDAGSSWDQLLDVTVFLTNMQDDFDTFNQIYGEYFKSNKPARTTVEITALPTPIAIELKCIASTD
jgi:2-aminomuconate deaminase